MGKRRVSSADKPSKDREKSWKSILKGLVTLIEDQQLQLESLVKERKFLEKRIQLQHDRWVSDVKLFDDQISQMKRESKIKDMARLVEVAKANLIIGMKQKEAIMYRHKLEDMDDERNDLKVLFDEISRCLAEPKRVTRSGKDTDVAALRAERDFAWNQYKKTDAKLQEQAERAKSDGEAANERVEKLFSDVERSEASNAEKDRMISALRKDVERAESESRRKSEEISWLSKELETLRSDSITPVLRRCMVESSTSCPGKAVGTKDLDRLHVSSEKGRRSSKRKSGETDLTVEKPRLFTSRFKVPKLKNPTPS